MFNLLVKYRSWGDGRDSIQRSRVFEYTEEYLVKRFEADGQLDFGSLIGFPTLFVQETTGAGDQVAHVGTITRARVSGSDIALDYAYDLGTPSIPNHVLRNFAAELDIAELEFSRTHWAVKDTELFRTLLRIAQPRRQRPSVFQIPEHENIEDSLVSVMMPFHPRFDAVYATLKQVADCAKLRCRRADDIWENPAVTARAFATR